MFLIVLVKFSGEENPHIYRVGHVSEAERLATMRDVQWVSHPFNASNGYYFCEQPDIIMGPAPHQITIRALPPEVPSDPPSHP